MRLPRSRNASQLKRTMEGVRRRSRRELPRPFSLALRARIASCAREERHRPRHPPRAERDEPAEAVVAVLRAARRTVPYPRRGVRRLSQMRQHFSRRARAPGRPALLEAPALARTRRICARAPRVSEPPAQTPFRQGGWRVETPQISTATPSRRGGPEHAGQGNRRSKIRRANARFPCETVRRKRWISVIS